MKTGLFACAMYRRLDVGMHGRKNGLTDIRTDWQTDVRTDWQTDGRMVMMLLIVDLVRLFVPKQDFIIYAIR